MIEVYDGLEGISRRAVELFIEIASEAVAERGLFSVALSGGSTPGRLYHLLASEPCRGRIPWNKVDVFFGDERCVPPEDQRSNFRLAFDALLGLVPARIHRVMGELPPGEAATEYDGELRGFLGRERRLDLVMLGVGEDGHTASLFPGSPALRETLHAAVAVYDLEIPRVTITLPVINTAANVMFLVCGGAKSDVVYEIIEHEPGSASKHPAAMVRLAGGRLIWLLDREAARKLPLG